MLVKSFLNNGSPRLKACLQQGGSFSVCLSHLDRLALTESALCPASKLNSRLYRPSFYSGFHGLCDRALYPVGGFDL